MKQELLETVSLRVSPPRPWIHLSDNRYVMLSPLDQATTEFKKVERYNTTANALQENGHPKSENEEQTSYWKTPRIEKWLHLDPRHVLDRQSCRRELRGCCCCKLVILGGRRSSTRFNGA